MKNQKLSQWGVIEIDCKSVSEINGGKWMEDLGYVCGSLVGHLTNAAEIIGNIAKDVVLSGGIQKGMRR